MRPDGTLIADSPRARGPGRRGHHRAAAAAGRSRRAARHHRLACTTRSWRCCRTRRRPRWWSISAPGAAGIDWQPDVKEELRLEQLRRRATRCRPISAAPRDNRLLVTVAEPVERDRPHRRHRAADPRGARGRCQPVRGADVDPGAVRPGAGADGAAVVVPVADHRAADPAAGRRGARRCARARAARAACRRRCWRARDEIGALAARAVGQRHARCGRGWTRSSASPPTWRTRSRTR